jgi:4a-hydroxytetrahydrobiopterin dehydratase
MRAMVMGHHNKMELFFIYLHCINWNGPLNEMNLNQLRGNMATPLTKSDIDRELKSLDGWNFKDDKISKEYGFNDFSEALGFLVRVGIEAEKQGHHPEIFNVYNTVRIGLSTHDAGDKVTQKDIDLAKAVDDLT